MTDKERQKLQERILGPVVPVNIPFRDDEEVDYGVLETYVDFLAQSRVPVIILTYGSSEYANLSDEEIYEITRVASRANGGRSVFVGATKAWSVKKSIEYIDFAQKHGACSVKVQPPFFGGSFQQDNLVEYYRRIDKGSCLPLWAYSIPVAGAHSGMEADTWGRISHECSSIYAMKTDGDMMYGYYSLIRASGKRATVVSAGQMKTMLYGWPLEARSFLCPIAPFMPRISLLFTGYMQQGHTDKAMEIIETFEDRIIGMCKKISWLPLIKGMLYVSGLFSTPKLRCPAYTVSAGEILHIKALYKEFQELAEKFI